MDFLLSDGLRPFSILAGFIVVLLVAEILLLLMGASSAVEVDAPPVDVDMPVDVAAFEGTVLTPDEMALLDVTPAQGPVPVAAKPSVLGRVLRLLGLGHGPLLVTLTGLAAGVSALGYALQLTVEGITGAMLPGWVAVLVVLVPGLWFGGRLAALAGRVFPQFDSHAISGQTFHGRRGEVVIGTARRGEPAQVRWRDSYGTTHSLMAEPLRDGDSVPAGAAVLIVKTRDRKPRIVTLTDA
ncbi:MAG: OB-fold-containig protein [Gemmobacter sp.]